VSHELDELARALAGKVSRRQALKRTFLAAAGAILALLLPARRARAAGNTESLLDEVLDLFENKCQLFCEALFGEDTPEATSCSMLAKQHTGPCYQFGPQSPGCATNNCPHDTVCVSASPYYQYTSTLPGSFICIPV
jgi:hypothetical protein